MDIDRDLLFAAAALKLGAIGEEPFFSLLAEWSNHRTGRLIDLLAERGPIGEQDLIAIERELGGRSTAEIGFAPDDSGDAGIIATHRGMGTTTQNDGEDAPMTPETVDSDSRDGDGDRGGIGGRTAETLVGAPSLLRTHDGDAPASSGHIRLGPIGDVTSKSRDRYSVSHLHAKGGIGQVWRALDPEFGREVALKELRPERNSSRAAEARFLTEARITGQLEHPGIVPVYEISGPSGDGHPFYTMRFIRGRTLSEAIREEIDDRREGRPDPLGRVKLLNTFVAVCNAVAYAHSRGVIHRDLKPENVVLGDFGEAIVLDWGLAKVDDPGESSVRVEHDTGHEVSVMGHVMGTPAYMAPEQAEGRWDLVGPHTDVYGLGAILYEILCGKPPFAGMTLTDILRKVVHDPPARPRRLQPDTPEALEAICLKAISKSPDDRYPTATALAEDVQRWLADEPVSAHRDPLTVRLGRWARRHRTGVAAAASLLLTGTLALALTAVVVGRERDEARRQRDEARRQRSYARQAVDDLYTDVAEKFLVDRDGPLQRAYLEKALASYERLASEEPGDASVRRGRGRAYFRIGEIQSRLGALPEAEAAYRRAIELIPPPAGVEDPEGDPRAELAQARSRLGVLLTRRNMLPEAERLLAGAVADQEALLAEGDSPDRRVQLARSDKELALLLHRLGRSPEAEAASAKALEVLEGGAGADDDLAESLEARGLLLREGGRAAEAEAALRRAFVLQDKADLQEQALGAPSGGDPGATSRRRDGLARTSNGLGLLLREAGRPAESEKALRRSLALYARLAADFPGPPEYRRGQARALVNLGIVLDEQARGDESERAYRDALPILERLAREVETDPKIRRDLARCSNNLAGGLIDSGRLADAAPFLDRAIDIYRTLSLAYPTVPEYAESLGVSLMNRASLDRQSRQLVEAEDRGREAVSVLAKAAGLAPDLPAARLNLAQARDGLAVTLAAADKGPEAEEFYRKALADYGAAVALRPDDADALLALSACSSNLAELRPKDAEALYRRSSEILESLLAKHPTRPLIRERLATIENNLGEWNFEAGHREEAAGSFARALALLEPLAQEYPEKGAYRYLLGYVNEQVGSKLLAGRAEGRAALGRAVYHSTEAVDLAPESPLYKRTLQAQLKALADAWLDIKDHATASRTAEQLLNTASAKSTTTRVEVARILSRCCELAAGDARVVEDYGKKGVAALKLAIEAGWKGASGLEKAPEFAALRGRDDFKALLTPPVKR